MDKIARRMNRVGAKARAPAPCAAGYADMTNWEFYNGRWLESLLVHTPLIDIEYLVLLARNAGILPRAQEVPQSALITAQNCWRIQQWGKTRRKYSLGVLVLSYTWLDAWHPDRLGAQLRRWLPILEAMLAEAKLDAPSCTVGVFIE